MKAMVIGISPNYNYPGSLKLWEKDNTYYASNFGASLIIRSLMKEFNADYIDDFSNLAELKNKYDTCIMGLATHAHPNRDISKYVQIVEKLDIKTIVISIGVTDYLNNIHEVYNLHHSVKRLFEIALSGSSWIGVRGPYTASLIQQNGFKNVVPIGCPTMYSNLSPDFPILTKENYSKTQVVYHKSIVIKGLDLIKNYHLIAQDYEDEAIFTENLNFKDSQLVYEERKFYERLDNSKAVIEMIKLNGYFPKNYNDWYERIGQSDFVFGTRLHGCIAALLQGIPAIFVARDIRVQEIAEMFSLPFVRLENINNITIKDLQDQSDFSKFQATYKLRYKNYLSFIHENKLESNLSPLNEPSDFQFLQQDLQTYNFLSNIQISNLKAENNNLLAKIKKKNKIKIFENKVRRKLNKLIK